MRPDSSGQEAFTCFYVLLRRYYYASRLSVARGKFGAQVLPLKLDVVRLFPLETSRGIDVISVRLTRVPAKMYECVNRVTSQLVV